ncbi:MAG: hypothetical protein V4440_07580 [Pseudomonadota bacterium]
MERQDNQILYNGRWISKEHFRAFVYNKTERRLAKSYEEYSSMIASGAWFGEPKSDENVVQMKRGKECRNQAKT